VEIVEVEDCSNPHLQIFADRRFIAYLQTVILTQSGGIVIMNTEERVSQIEL
jgi:hypothetical protein